MNNFLEFHDKNIERLYDSNTWELLKTSRYKIPPFQIELDESDVFDYTMYQTINGSDIDITSYLNRVSPPPIGTIIRNVENDYRLDLDEETIITVTSVDSSNNRLTFSELPDNFYNVLGNPESDKEWIAINIDSQSGSPPPSAPSGNYTQVVKVDSQYSGLTFNVSTISGYGTVSGWSVGDQVTFVNPFIYSDTGESNNYDLELSDFTAFSGISGTLLAPGPLMKRSDNTWQCIFNIVGSGLSSRTIVKATADFPLETWTAQGDILITASDYVSGSDYYSSGIGIVGNAVYLEDEDKYISAVNTYNSDTGKQYPSIIKYDEDFTDIDFYREIFDESTSDNGVACSSIIKHNGIYYFFYYDKGSGTYETEAHITKVRKSENYDSGWGDAITLYTGSIQADGAPESEQNKWYNGHMDGVFPFEFGGKLYAFATGESRYKESSTMANRVAGLVEYDTNNDELIFKSVGVVFPSFITGAWSDTSWAQDHTGPVGGAFFDGRDLYVDLSMLESSDTYKTIIMKVDVEKLIATNDRFINWDGYLKNTLTEGVCYFKLKDEHGNEWRTNLINVCETNSFLKSWTIDSGTAVVSGKNISSMDSGAEIISNGFTVIKNEEVHLVYEYESGTSDPTVELYNSSGTLISQMLRYKYGDIYVYKATSNISAEDAYIKITANSNYVASSFDILKDYSESYLKFKVSSDSDYGRIKYSNGFEQWIYKSANVRKSPRLEMTQTGDERNGKIIIEKSVSAVRYNIRMKVTEHEFDALVHAVNGDVEITDQTGRTFTATKIELSDPTWYNANGIVEFSFVDENNINVYTKNNSLL